MVKPWIELTATERSSSRLVPPAVRAHPTIHPRRTARPRRVTGRQSGSCSSAVRAGDDPVNCLYVVDIASRRGATDRRSADAADRGTTPTTCRPRSRPAANACARQPRGSRRSPPMPRSRSWRSRWPAACSSPACSAAWHASWWSTAPSSTHGPTPPRGAGLRMRPLAAHRRTRRQQLGTRRATRTPRSSWGSADFIAGRGDPPQPWLLVEPGRLGRSRPAASACADVGRLVHRRPGNTATSRRASALPAAGTANAVVELHVLALDGGAIDVAWDRDRVPVPHRRLLGARRATAVDRAVARSTRRASARGRPDHR